jgi:bifunctional DNA-binding transcriptional regulator/antitoxin component of YhaV-PrlF toxin-antitoxin module
MAIARSKITAEGQVSIPADVRRKLLARRAGRFSSEDIHKAIFGARTPAKRSLDDLKEGIRRHVRKRYLRG